MSEHGIEAGMVESAVYRLLAESTQTVLETMFFAMPDKVSADPERPSGALIAASLTFHGTPPGWFGLLLSEGLAKTLAGNFIGCDDADALSPAEVAGVIAELSNMLCGAALSDLQSQTNFELSTPEPRQIGTEAPAPDFTAGSPFICRFEFSEGTLVLFLTFEEAA
ncbi:MAG TPA: chemotaxis protein CheX [Bryobacteraceae bacterium]|jgi:CheY-specific phosphatase CheX